MMLHFWWYGFEKSQSMMFYFSLLHLGRRSMESKDGFRLYAVEALNWLLEPEYAAENFQAGKDLCQRAGRSILMPCSKSPNQPPYTLLSSLSWNGFSSQAHAAQLADRGASKTSKAEILGALQWTHTSQTIHHQRVNMWNVFTTLRGLRKDHTTDLCRIYVYIYVM